MRAKVEGRLFSQSLIACTLSIVLFPKSTISMIYKIDSDDKANTFPEKEIWGRCALGQVFGC